MAKELKLYERTKMLIAKREKTDKPIVIKGDLEKYRLYMVVGRTTFFSTDAFSVPNYYVLEYLKFLSDNGFSVTTEMKADDKTSVRCFKARLKNVPNLDEIKKPFHEEDFER